jgi:hypothetical protein
MNSALSPEQTDPRNVHHTLRALISSATHKQAHGEKIRRVSNGGQVTRVAALAMKGGKSVDFTAYW